MTKKKRIVILKVIVAAKVVVLVTAGERVRMTQRQNDTVVK